METKTHSGPIYFICFCNGFVHFSDSLCSIQLRQWCESWHLSLHCAILSTLLLFPLTLSPVLFIYLFVCRDSFVCLFVCFFIPFHSISFCFSIKTHWANCLSLHYKTQPPMHACMYVHTHNMPFQLVEVCKREREKNVKKLDKYYPSNW